MAKFNQYPEKANLNDSDLFLIYSASEGLNKTLKSSSIDNYIKKKTEFSPDLTDDGILVFGGNEDVG